MITITNIRQAKPNDFDEIWAIVRSLKSKSPYLIQVPELSPSWNLFKKYLALKEQNNWNENTFQTVYRPQFLTELAQDKQAQAKMEELISKHNAGKSIALVCFCTDPNLCHRSIISDILHAKGIPHTIN